VVHRIPVACFFTALIFSSLGTRAMMVHCVCLLVGYWALMSFVPVPGAGAPDLRLAGRNLAHYVDQLYLPGRRFKGTLLRTVAAVANCLVGILPTYCSGVTISPDRRKCIGC